MDEKKLKELYLKLAWQRRIRMIGSFFVLALYFVVWRMQIFVFNFWAFALVCAFEGMLNQPYDFILRRFKKVEALQKSVYFYLILDIVVISLIMYILGATDFYLFGAAYYLVIIYAGILLRKRDCYHTAFVCSLALAVVLTADYVRVSPILNGVAIEVDSMKYLAVLSGNALFFFFVAYLAGFSKELLEEEKAKLVLEEELSEARSEIVDVVSHEMRDPINSINGFLILILNEKMGALNDQLRKYLGLAHSQVKSLMKLVDNLLDVSMLEAGKVEIHRAKIGLRPLMEEILQAKNREIEEREIKVSLSIAEEAKEIEADPELVYRLFSNLISNAVKYNQIGGSIAIAAFKEGRELRISVKDTGFGIKKEDLERVFQKFYRGEEMPYRSRGSGLGLAICKEIATLFGGSIKANSEGIGAGTEFVVSLPLTKD